MNLFASEESGKGINLSLENGDISYFSNFFSSEEASVYFRILKNQTDWQQDDIKVFGKIYKQPRLTALYGDGGATYTYSGITMFPKPFSKALKEIKNKIEKVCDLKFNSVLLNFYRDGSDSNGWHSDDEKELGINPAIASISFGAVRTFQLRHKKDRKNRKNIQLEDGSLLLMQGTTQHFWQHQIPKLKKVKEERINLTFRLIN
jgi:alkylated DNA repair dioxygenase AlkB